MLKAAAKNSEVVARGKDTPPFVRGAVRGPQYAGSAGILPALWATEDQEGKESS